MAVHKVNVGHAPVVPRDGHHPRLVEDAKPHYGEDVEGIPER